MFNILWRLLRLYCDRKDLQSHFPEVKEGNLNRLLNWAAYTSQNLVDDKNAFEYLKGQSDFFYYAKRFDNFLPHPNWKKLPKLFFIFGAGRSGTSLLTRIMTCHSLTHAIEEGRAYHGINNPLLLKYERIFESKKQWLGLKCPVMTDCLLDNNFINLPMLGHTKEISKNFRELYDNQPIIFLIRDVRDRVSSVIKQGQKTKVNFKGLEKIFQTWINLNPYIQKNFGHELSTIKNFKNKIYGYEALEWKIKNSAFFVYKERSLPILLIKYEDLVAKTEKTLRKVSSFLDIPYEKSLLDYYKIPHSGLKSAGISQNFDVTTRKADSKSIGLHKKHLSSTQTNEIMEITSDLMREFNY